MLYLMQAWLATSGVNVKALGLFALVGFPYTFKFLWAPFMDRFSLGPLGRRRGWMALTQLALFGVIGAMGALDPRTQLSADRAGRGRHDVFVGQPGHRHRCLPPRDPDRQRAGPGRRRQRQRV